MLDSFLTFINLHELKLDEKPTLLAVSGGVDSVVMAHLFYKLGLPAGIAHCNFGLRGKDSEQDESFVKAVASDYKYPFFTEKFDTKLFSENHSVSTQMAARELRYSWFETIRIANGFHWTATAHHANDSLETVLLNLVRGTALSGMHGILVMNHHVIRPMLFATKEEILFYAEDNNLTWREDSSNDSDNYKRNVIRHHVIPVLKQLNPSLELTFTASSERLRASNVLLNEFLEDWQTENVKVDQKGVRIDLKTLVSASEPTFRLWSILKSYGFAYKQAEMVFKSLAGISGKLFMSETHTLLRNRDELIVRTRGIRELEHGTEIFDLETDVFYGKSGLYFEILERNEEFEIKKDRNFAYIDADLLKFPLTLRKWVSGDIFFPFGMKGKRKKISDLLIDLKVDIFEKEEVFVLVNGNEDIIWVIGIRSDERFRVVESTRHVVEIAVITKN